MHAKTELIYHTNFSSIEIFPCLTMHNQGLFYILHALFDKVMPNFMFYMYLIEKDKLCNVLVKSACNIGLCMGRSSHLPVDSASLPGCPQGDHRMTPGWPMVTSEWPRIISEWPRMTPGGPRMSPGWPRMTQDDPKVAKYDPRMTPGWQMMTPGWTRRIPGWLIDLLKMTNWY